MKAFLLTFACFFAGCGMSTSPTVYVDRDFGDDVPVVLAAMESWAPAVDMRPVMVSHADALKHGGGSSIAVVAMFDMSDAEPAFTTKTTSLINVRYLRRTLDGAEFQRGIAHELGHAMGLKHEPDSLMVNSFTGPRAPTCADFRALADALGSDVPAGC